MVKKRPLNKLKTELANLREKKRKAIKHKGQLLARQKEMHEIRELEKEVEFLKGVGTKRRIAKEVGMRLGKQAGSFGWKGLKFAGKVVKGVVMAEVKRQAVEKARPRPKVKKRVLNKVKTKTKAKTRPKTKTKRRVNKRK